MQRKKIIQTIYLVSLTRGSKKQQKQGPPTGVERIYALPTAQQVRCVTTGLPGSSWATLENLTAKDVKQQYSCY